MIHQDRIDLAGIRQDCHMGYRLRRLRREVREARGHDMALEGSFGEGQAKLDALRPRQKNRKSLRPVAGNVIARRLKVCSRQRVAKFAQYELGERCVSFGLGNEGSDLWTEALRGVRVCRIGGRRRGSC